MNAVVLNRTLPAQEGPRLQRTSGLHLYINSHGLEFGSWIFPPASRGEILIWKGLFLYLSGNHTQ